MIRSHLLNGRFFGLNFLHVSADDRIWKVQVLRLLFEFWS